MRILVLLLLLYSLPGAATNLLFIHSYHEGYPWVQDYRRAILDNLSQPVQVEDFLLDSKRLPYEEYVKRADMAWNVIKSRRPDMIVLADDNAITLLSERIATTDIPVVFLGLNTNPRDHGIQTYEQFTGVLERPLFKRSLLLVDHILPKAESRKLLVLSDNSATSRAALSPISDELKPIRLGNLTIEFKLADSEQAWRQAVLNAKQAGYQGIFIALYHTITSELGEHVDPEKIIAWTAKESPVPNFGFWDFTIGKQANTGGYVLNGYEHGKLAATLINKLLHGAKAKDLGYISDSKGSFRFSLSGVARWHLSIPKEMSDKAQWVD
ncbi:ABC transporter substrate-binding protein [Shewanella marisflavi]|uniref:ABC transporter substrate-binding protein n=1 Tax=Shewanella marisflavi TaxID=260364 RepID=UPI003AAE1E90